MKKDFKYRFVFCYLSKIAVIAGVSAVVLTLVVSLHRMVGNRMFPSVRDGDLGIFYRLTDCHTNDVVLYTDKTGQVTAGRIIAVGGQTVEFFKDGGYEVDGASSGYTVESTNSSGTLAEDTNVSFTNTRNGTVPTAAHTNILISIGVFAIALAGLFWCLRKRK